MVSVIIATHNNLSHLKDCLLSLSLQSFADLEVIVIFNNSPQEAIDMVRNRFSNTICVVNKDNLLFCRAYNQGIKKSQGEYVLCLNDDIELEPNFIKEVIAIAKLDEKIGMVTGKILRKDKITIDSTGLFLGRNRTPLERGFNQSDNGQYDKDGYVFGVSGCAGLHRRKMLEELRDSNGYFDEKFGMFYEDLDLAWRANKKGWKAYYAPRAIAYHKRGASTKTIMPPRILRKYNFAYLDNELKMKLIKNRYRTMAKNDTFIGILLNLPFILAYELKLYFYSIFFCPEILIKILKNQEKPHLC